MTENQDKNPAPVPAPSVEPQAEKPQENPKVIDINKITEKPQEKPAEIKTVTEIKMTPESKSLTPEKKTNKNKWIFAGVIIAMIFTVSLLVIKMRRAMQKAKEQDAELLQHEILAENETEMPEMLEDMSNGENINE